MKKGQLYEIHWIDIIHDNTAWHAENNMVKFLKDKTPLFINVGYYFGSNKDYHMFYSGISGMGEYFDSIRIPKLVIKKIISK